jgi:hypothetical protein
MNYWNPYMNNDVSYDEGYDVDEKFVDEMTRNENNPNPPAPPTMPPAPPTMPAALPPMPVVHTYFPSCGCHPIPTWHGTIPWQTGEMTSVADMGSPDMGTSMPMGTMAPMTGMPVPMEGTMAPMMGAQMPFSYGPSYYGMPPYTYGYVTSPGYYPYR